MLLSNEQLAFYRDRGYLVVRRHVPKAKMKAAQDAAMRVVEKCAEGNFPYCRAYTRLSDRFIEKIDNIFHPDIWEPELFRATVESQILDYAKEALGYRSVFLSFFRMHPTVGYSTWSSWHRDDRPDGRDWTIKATLPLFPECGFYVVPGSHRLGDMTIDGVDTKFKGHMNREVCVPVEAGDILLFHTAIAHRGSCAGRDKYRRAQLHFRVTATEYASETPQVEGHETDRPEVMEMADASWREALSFKAPAGYPPTRRKPPVSPKERALARLFYFGTSLLPSRHKWLSEPPGGRVPYVRVPEEYRALYE